MNVVDQLTATLQGEYAATYAYGIIGATVSGSAVDRARRALASHENNRDWLRDSLLALQAQVPIPEPAYEASPPITDVASAIALAITIELRLTRQWAALAALSGGKSRVQAARVTQECAVRAVTWGDPPSAYPGERPKPEAI
jgi:hypothetical protein